VLPFFWLQAAADELLLLILLLPLGLLLLRLGERLLRFRPRLLDVERLLLAFYLAGGLLFVLASIGLPLFQLPVVVGLIAAGVASMAFLWGRDRGRTLAGLTGRLARPSAMVVLVGFLGILLLELYGVRGFGF
jgi:hypothetical protein